MISEELTQQSKPWFVFVSAAAFAVILFFSVYYEIQQARYGREIAKMEARKEELIAQNKTSNEADRAKAVSAKDYLKDIEKKQVIWSKIIEKIEGTIPRRSDTMAPVVSFRSYNGSSEGRMAVNANTQPDAVDPFTDISFTIKAFTSDPTFKNVFIPSVARSITPDGRTVMTFSMNFEYDPKNLVSRARVEQAPTGIESPELGIGSATATTSISSSLSDSSTPIVETTTPAVPATTPVTPAVIPTTTPDSVTPVKPAAPTTPVVSPASPVAPVLPSR